MFRRSTAVCAAAVLTFYAAKAIAATTTCSTVAACVMGVNAASGYGVEGTSKSSTGVLGTTSYNATSATASKRGVQGIDQSTSSKGYNVGVYGLSTFGTGIRGDSKSGIGAIGTSVSNVGVSGKSGSDTGVSGTSLSSYGVSGTSKTSAGVIGITSSISNNVAGVIGSSPYNSEAESGTGVIGDTYDGVGVQALAESSEFNFPVALQAVAGDQGVTVFEGVSQGSAVASIDGFGNMILAGSLQQNGSPFFRTSGANGSSVTTFGDRISQPTLEDLGEARMVNGKADVLLDARFGASVDARSNYLVFLTPMGDTRGLYVSSRTCKGFTVREVGGGRSSLVFDYRIAAKPYDTAALRLPSTRTLPQLRRNVVTPLRPGVRHHR